MPSEQNTAVASMYVIRGTGRPRLYPACTHYPKQHQFHKVTGRCACGYVRPSGMSEAQRAKRAEAMEAKRAEARALAEARRRELKPWLHPGCQWFRKHLRKEREWMDREGETHVERYCPCGWNWDTLQQEEPTDYDMMEYRHAREWAEKKAKFDATDSEANKEFRLRMMRDPV